MRLDITPERARTRVPRRLFLRLRPVCALSNPDVIAIIDRAIRFNRRIKGDGSYLLGDQSMVFVMSEGESFALRALIARPECVIGLYASGKRATFPDRHQLRADLDCHFTETRR